MTDTNMNRADSIELADQAEADRRFTKMVERLNRLSVSNHHDAYEDIPWDEPEMAIDESDPRWRLYDHDPLSTTEWYRSLSPTDKSRAAIRRQSSMMKVGIQFENMLQRGLLRIAWAEPNGSPVYRYSHHEVIEESQHSMMFQEFVNRTNPDVKGMGLGWRLFSPRLVLTAAAISRPMFFVLVLGGEEPVDYQQRLCIRAGTGHPLAERIMQIHVAEEARHISFAKTLLEREVPELNPVRRFLMSLHFPLTMGAMARIMLVPDPAFCKEFGLSRREVRELFRSEIGRDYLASSVSRMQRFAGELGLLNPIAKRVWKALGVWSDGLDDGRQRAASSSSGDAASDG